PPRHLHSFPTRRSSDLRTSASYHDLCAGASATRHALPGGSPRAVKALRLAAHSAATRRRADASRRSRVGRQRFLMESRQVLAFRSEEHTSELQSPCNLV